MVEDDEEEEAAFLKVRVLRARAVFFDCFLDDEDDEEGLFVAGVESTLKELLGWGRPSCARPRAVKPTAPNF